jgi:hypothetical protein
MLEIKWLNIVPGLNSFTALVEENEVLEISLTNFSASNNVCNIR